MKKIIQISLIVLFLAPSLALASELVLKSGEKLEGKIVEETNKYIKFDSGVGIVTTYYADEVDNVDGQALKAMGGSSASADAAAVHYVVSSREKSDYTDSFKELFEAAKIKDQHEYLEALSRLNNFRNKYSRSPLAQDAYYVPLLVELTGAVMGKKSDVIDKYMPAMEEFVQLYPKGEVNPLTKEIWVESLGGVSSWVLDIPFDLILDYLRGTIAFVAHDYETCIKYFTVLKDHQNFFDSNNQEIKELVQIVFWQLSNSYIGVNKQDDLKRLDQEVKEKFPEDKRLQEVLDNQISLAK